MSEQEAGAVVSARTPVKASELDASAIECFRALVNGVELMDVHLVETKASLSPKYLFARGGDESPAALYVHMWHTEYRAQLYEGDNVLYCGVRFRMTEDEHPAPNDAEITHDQYKDVPAVVDVGAEYALLYRVPDGIACTNEGTQLFAAHNAIFNAWPFFRELAHSLVSRMGLPPVIVPLFRLPLTRPK